LTDEYGDENEEDLCSESSWDPNEDDEKELIDAVMSEADKKIYKERKDAALKQEGSANPNA
jgi:hypothetical protein